MQALQAEADRLVSKMEELEAFGRPDAEIEAVGTQFEALVAQLHSTSGGGGAGGSGGSGSGTSAEVGLCLGQAVPQPALCWLPCIAL